MCMIFQAGFLTRMLPIKTSHNMNVKTHQLFDGCFVVSEFNASRRNAKKTNQTNLEQDGSL